MTVTVGGYGPQQRTVKQRGGQLPARGEMRRLTGPRVEIGLIAASPDEARKVRAKALRQSRRHTLLVRGLRLIFPLLALATIVIYVTALKKNWSVELPGGGQIDFASVGFNGQNLVVNNPRYRGFSKDGGSFLVTAKTGIQDPRRMELIELKEISGKMLQQNGTEFRLTSQQGLFDNKKNELELWDQIYLESDNGMKGWLSRATVYVKENRITSKEPVLLQTQTGTIRADTMVVHQKEHKAAFEGGVKVRLVRAQANSSPSATKPGPSMPAAAPPATVGKPKPAPPAPQLRSGQLQ